MAYPQQMGVENEGMNMLRQLLMVSVGAAALLSAQAQAASFGYTGAEQTYDITTTGVYDFIAAGAAGASAHYVDRSLGVGGAGARLEGMTTLTAGSVLDIFVGGAGGFARSAGGGGGGGGTFVFLQPSGSGLLTADTALIVGGGGGGGGLGSSYADLNGASAVGTGGNGQGGLSGDGRHEGSAGGAGVGGNGASSVNSYIGTLAYGGSSPANGGSGGGYHFTNGANGGFGGGGGANFGGGGGGGFTGGDGGAAYNSGGGAGTSYLRDSATLVSQGLNASSDGDGSFDIALAPAVSAAPEPATWLTMMLGLGGAGLMLRRRQGVVAPRTA